MKTTRVRYARLKNLGNYENERAEVEIQLEEHESIAVAFARATDIVNKQLGIHERVRVKTDIIEDVNATVLPEWMED